MIEINSLLFKKMQNIPVVCMSMYGKSIKLKWNWSDYKDPSLYSCGFHLEIHPEKWTHEGELNPW